MRLIGPNGEQVGVIATSVALNLAKEANLDLVEVAPNAKPPVAKLIDYGKFKYNEKIKAREARRNQNTAEIKEIRFRLKIDDHDFEVKKGHVVRFLNGGDKVKVTIMLRGREQSRPIGGVEMLQRLAADVEEYGTIESAPKQEGRNIIMTLAPKGKKVHTQSEQRRRGAESRAERQARQAARLAAKQEAQAQAGAVLETASKEAGQVREQTRREIERDKMIAKKELQREIGDMAVLAAGKIIGEELNPKRQAEVVEKIIEEAEDSSWKE